MSPSAPGLAVTTDILDLHRLARDVDRLTGLAPVPPAVRAEAVGAWLAHRPTLTPLVVRIVRDDEVAGLAVLAWRRRHGVMRVVKAGQAGEPWDVVLAEPTDAHAMAAAVAGSLEQFHRPWVLHLPDLPPASRFAGSLAATLRHAELADGVVAARLDVSSQLAWTAVTTRNTRSQLAKARNRIRHDGRTLTLHWLTDEAEIADRLADVVAVRAARNAQLGRGPGPDPVEVATFEATVRAHARAGRARVLVAQIDASTAAFAVCFVSDDVLWVHANAVSPDQLRYSVGAIANAEVTRAAHADPGLRAVDWGSGLQRYKVSGPVTVRTSTVLEAWSSPWVRFAGRAARMVAAAGPRPGPRHGSIDLRSSNGVDAFPFPSCVPRPRRSDSKIVSP